MTGPGSIETDLAGAGSALRVMGGRLEKYERELPKANVRALRRGLHFARNLALERFRSTGIGRSIFGDRKGRSKARSLSGLRPIVTRSRVRSRGGGILEGGIVARGIAGLMETGGRTKAHLIKRRRGKLLSRAIHHPGSRIPRSPVLAGAVNDAAPKIRGELELEARKLWAAVVGA